MQVILRELVRIAKELHSGQKRGKIDEAIDFWQDVDKTFPGCVDVRRWLNTLRTGRGDWFRNGSAALIARDQASNNKYGRLDLESLEANKKKLDALLDKHPVTRQFQS